MNKDIEAIFLKFIELMPGVSQGLTQQRLDACISRLSREIRKSQISFSDIKPSLVEKWIAELNKTEILWSACSKNLIAPLYKVNGGKITNWQFHKQRIISRIDEARLKKLEIQVWPIQIVSGNRLDDPRNGPLYNGEFFYTTPICKYIPLYHCVETLNTLYELVGERGSDSVLPESMSAEQVREYYMHNADLPPK